MKNLITLFTIIAINTSIANAQWQQVGLDSLNVMSIATDGTNIYAGTDLGVFLSYDDGNSWTSVLSNTWGVRSIVIDGTNIFVGSSVQGVYLSTDTGNSWTNIGLSNDTLTSLAVSGTNIFAGADNYYTGSGGVFLSTDTGGIWTKVSQDFNGFTDPHVTSLTIIGNNIFAGTIYGGVFLSTDSGSNWNQVNNGLTNFWIFSIASYGNNIFVGADSRVFLSTDNGNLWTPTDPIIFTVWDFDTSGTNIFAGTTNGVFLSTNGGNLWTAVNNDGFLFPYTIRSIAIKGNYIYAGTEGGYGIWRRQLSEIVGIKENAYNADFTLYPNPVNAKSVINLNEFSNYELLITDITGKIVHKENYIGSSIPIGNLNLPVGMYCFIITDSDKCFNGKFMVQP